ncbi:hypothetical protein [Bacillus sp. SG-1]|uniref:hypothetical protein n=1 Tax=Bacillus sp. SG-1 TaxID=161544 RepID=UPI00015437AD|nr:hypothetical protein [Bacillus sp. SG-1]EDL66708.1 hypothetical protein BSG1_05110 [Bacillus sp. SG-1]
MKSIIVFFLVYLLLSLPAMFSFGYVIDWVPEATLLQKFKGYVVEGLVQYFLLKVVISIIAAFSFHYIPSLLQRK